MSATPLARLFAEASRRDVAELDAAELDAAELDAVELDTAELEAPELEALERALEALIATGRAACPPSPFRPSAS